MRTSRSVRPSSSSPPSARRQRRRRWSSASGIAVDSQNELEQRQRLREGLLVDCGGDSARRRRIAPDLIEQPAALDRAEARKGASQHRQDFYKIGLLRRGQPFIDDFEERRVVQDYLGALADEAIEKAARGLRWIRGRQS